jgi:hypothetical protein
VFDLAKAQGVVRLHPAEPVSFLVEGGAEGAATLFLDLPETPGESSYWFSKDSRSVRKGERFEVALPRGAAVSAAAIDRLGLEARASFVAEQGQEVDLRLAAQNALSVSLIPSPQGAWAEATFDHAFKARLRPSPEGELVVPRTDRLTRLLIFCSGFRTIQLSPHPSSRPEQRAGKLVLELEPAFRTRFRLLDASSLPVAGVRLRAGSSESFYGLYPDLHGGWPTTHPAWIFRREEVSSMTDGRGECDLELPEGSQDLDLCLPEVHQHLVLGPSCFARHRISVPSDSVVELAVPRARFVAIEAFESTTGLPVESILVATSLQTGTTVEGNRWEGWVTDQDRAVEVSSPGLGSETIDVSSAGQSHFEAMLWCDDPATVSLHVDGSLELPSKLTFEVVEPETNGFQRIHVVEVSLDAHGLSKLCLPFEGDLTVVPMLSGQDPATVVFTPRSLPYERGASLSFHLARKP